MCYVDWTLNVQECVCVCVLPLSRQEDEGPGVLQDRGVEQSVTHVAIRVGNLHQMIII